MNVSEGVQVFVLIYVLVMVALYFSSRFWLLLLTKLKRSLGLAAPASAANPPPIPGDGSGSLSYSFRPGAPRPPRLRKPVVLGSDSPNDRLAYCRRLSLCTRLVTHIASANPTGFPIGLYREWHEARWETYCDDTAIGSEQAISFLLFIFR